MLGSMRSVPDRPTWYYGLAHRNEEGIIEVRVFEMFEPRRSFSVSGRYWTRDDLGEKSIATQAQEWIDALEKKRI
jgi:hypothetical protein